VDSRKVGNEAVLIGNQLVCHRNEKLLDFILGQVRRVAFFAALKFVIALPDGAAVFVGGVPNLSCRTVRT